MLAGLALVLAGPGCAGLSKDRYVDPLTPTERLNLGVTYEHEGRLDAALREYKRAATGEMESLALTYQANVHLSLKNYNEARLRYESALEIDPEMLMAANNLAWLLAKTGEDLEWALVLIEAALEREPEHREAFESTRSAVLEAMTRKSRD